MNACILTIGYELLQGYTLDTNSYWLSNILNRHGILIEKVITVGDSMVSIIDTIDSLLIGNYNYLFITGGLGPTHDDITMSALKKYLNGKIIFDEKYYKKLELFFFKKNKSMPIINKSQAMILNNTDPIPNLVGSARGIDLNIKKTRMFVMPGVPSEMKSMVRNYILPKYFNNNIRVINHITINTVGIFESKLAEKLNSLIEEHKNDFQFAFLPDYKGVKFRIKGKQDSSDIKKISKKFYKFMSPYSYSYDNIKLEEVVGKLIKKNKMTLSIAESCTGGVLSSKFTSIAGCSKYFLGGIIAYSNKLKSQLLDVSKKTLNNYGAVSEEVAKEMALGISKHTGSNIGISITGISGPEGGTESKPIGLVYIGLSIDKKVKVKKYNILMERNNHREASAIRALNFLRRSLK
tara:strand:- start:241 stop:1461 length:1221 start_codon:yes stop_codon:yes gene_type:complete